jgi:exosortase/archaeosortase family protein
LLFLAIPAAILLNIIRVLTTIMVFYYFQCDLSYGLMHEIFGVFLFFLAIAFILLGQRGLSRWDSHSVQE